MAVRTPTGHPGFMPLVHEARTLLKGSKTVTALVALSFLACMALYIAVLWRYGEGSWMTVTSGPRPRDAGYLLGAVLPLIFSSVFVPALIAIGLGRSAGRPISYLGAMRSARLASRFLVLGGIGLLIQYLLSTFASPFDGLLNTMYNTLALFAAFLIVDRGFGTFEALAGSWRLIRANVRSVLLLVLLGVMLSYALAIVMALFLALSPYLAPIMVGMALVWALPFMLVLAALVYRRSSTLPVL